MTERIRELAEQAGATLTKGYIELPDGQLMLSDGADVDHTTMDLAKFAELIVRECIRIPYDMWDKAELNADIAVKIEHRFKEHFGVEE